MKNMSRPDPGRKKSTEDLRPEYRFDYTKARPNRFTDRRSPATVVVLLDKDVAKVFRNSESVNSALRALLSAVPSSRAARPKT